MLKRKRGFLAAYLTGRPGTKAQVSVRCDGIGRIEIRPNVVLGYKPAIRLESGEILRRQEAGARS